MVFFYLYNCFEKCIYCFTNVEDDSKNVPKRLRKNVKHQKVSDGEGARKKHQISVALAYDAARAIHVCGFKKNSPSCLNHHENFLDLINIRSEALFVCIFYLRDHICVYFLKKDLFSCFGNQFSSFTYGISSF